MCDLISVIVPVYNTGTYLEGCIKSIVNQDYPNIEIILVDDGSTDKNTLGKCEELSGRYSNVRLLHKQNGGSASARNYGVKHAKGKYVGFVDSDDVIYPSMYSTLYSLILKYQVNISVCGIATEENGDISYTDQNIKNGKYDNYELMHYFLLGHWHSACTSLYLKSELDNIFFPEGEVNEDYMFNYWALKKQESIGVTCEPLYRYLRRDGSNTSSPKTLKFLDWIKHTSFILDDMKRNPQLRGEAEYQFLYSNIVLGNSALLTLSKGNFGEALELYQIVSDNLKDNRRMLHRNKFLSKRNRFTAYALAYAPKAYKSLVLKALKVKKQK